MAAPSLSYPLAKMNMKMGVGQLADWTDVQWLEKLISGGRNEMKISSISLSLIFERFLSVC